MKNLVLVINPGSTSTKIAVYDKSGKEIINETICHHFEEISKYEKIIDQYRFRAEAIKNILFKNNISIKDFMFIVGRGGFLKPISSGTWTVNEQMISDLKKAERGEHASNLGAIIAYDIAKDMNIPSYIVDPIVVDELDDVARISGIPEIERSSVFHALNQKATARKAAADIGKEYEELNVIVAHMGGGITVGAHKKGRVIDVNNGIYGEGPMTPERSGSLPVENVVNMCFSGKYTKDEIIKKIHGKGGVFAYLGTENIKAVCEEAGKGNKKYQLILDAMAYQIAKELGAMATVLEGKVDCIVLTGGIAYEQSMIKKITDKVKFISKIIVYPGENEMEALFQGAMLSFTGKTNLNEYK